MKNELIKVNKKKSNSLKENKISLIKNNLKDKPNVKRLNSINKLQLHIKNDNLLNKNNVVKKKLSVDISNIKKSSKINKSKKKENNIILLNKNIKRSQKDMSHIQNNNFKELELANLNKVIHLNKSLDKIKIPQNQNKKGRTLKMENIYKSFNTQNSEQINLDKKVKKEIVNNSFVKNIVKTNTFKRQRKRAKTGNKFLNKNHKHKHNHKKSNNIQNDLKEIKNEFNNINQIKEKIYKEFDEINKNNDEIIQNELKINQIIKSLGKEDNIQNKLLKDSINNEKNQYKYLLNNIILNNEKINKLKQIKKDIENNIINNNLDNIFLFNNKNILSNSKNLIQKYINLSKEIQNSQKIINNNLIYEINYLKNSIEYLKYKEKTPNNTFNVYTNNKDKNFNNNINKNIIEKNNLINNEINIITKNEEQLEIYNKLRESLIKNLDKENLKKIVLMAPKKDNSELSDLINYLRNNTNNLNIVEKSYVVFYWMAENIIYDLKAKKTGEKIATTPEEIYKYGKSVCFGYSRLFAHIANSLGISTENINGYAKGYEYKPGEKNEKTNHEWNAVKIDNNYYLIDSTWGSGNEEGDNHFKELDDFYFFCNPKHLIFTHYPQEEKWQLLNPPISKEEFFDQVYIQSPFFAYHFTDINFKKSHFIANNLEIIKISYDTKDTGDIIDISVDLEFLNNNSYIEEDDCCYIIKNEKFFEVKCIFNKIGNYKICIFGKNQYMDEYEEMLNYYPECKQNIEKELHFPKLYSDSSDIQIVQPLYDNLKSGDEVTFIIKSNILDELIIIGEHLNYLKKNNDGYFEKTIKIGTKCAIGKKNQKGQCIYLVKYNILN